MLDVQSLPTPQLTQCWHRVNTLINHWLSERQSLIVQFCQLSDTLKTTHHASVSLTQHVSHLCDTLVDYVCAGHFEIYYQLLDEAENFNDGSASKAKALMPLIAKTTQSTLDFNDRYGDQQTALDTQVLSEQLSQLGETLETRFNLEDRLIAKLHRIHANAS